VSASLPACGPRAGGWDDTVKTPCESTALETAFRRCSPRLNPRRTPLAGVLLYTAIVALWMAAMVNAFVGQGLFAWSVGVVYIAYDACLLAFVAWQALALWRRPEKSSPYPVARPTIGVVIAAYNEGAALAATIDALLRQSDPPIRSGSPTTVRATRALPFSPSATVSRRRRLASLASEARSRRAFGGSDSSIAARRIR